MSEIYRVRASLADARKLVEVLEIYEDVMFAKDFSDDDFSPDDEAIFAEVKVVLAQQVGTSLSQLERLQEDLFSD